MKKIILVSFISLFAVTGASAAYFDYAPAPVCGIQITVSLSPGSTNPEVYILQSFLKQSGYMNTVPNGNFGPQTKAAVRAFQRDNGISMTGTVGPATRNAINERLCDADQSVLGGDYGYTYDTYNSGVTYVDSVDPFVRVVTPSSQGGAVYNNPGMSFNSYSNSYASAPSYPATPVTAYAAPQNMPQVGAANIVYSPYVGYTYGITPLAGSLTITSPIDNQQYSEGDTVYVAWSTNNLATNNQYVILLESVNTRQNTVVAVTSSNNASFALTKSMLDKICSGTCDYGYNQNGQYRVVITTPVADIAGQSTTFRASANVTIRRPFTFTAGATISPNKNPVNSGELFRMYVNMPNTLNNYNYVYPTLTFKMRAICPSNVTVSIAGVQCGSEFTLPYAYSNNQQEIPVVINNVVYYPQTVTFEVVTYNGTTEVSKSQTQVTVNGAAFNY